MTVEDGTGLSDSNSYVSVAFADDYFTSRGVSEWTALETTAKESALIRATDFVDNCFEWKGQKGTYEQALQFPRKNLTDKSGYSVVDIPTVLKQAVCEASLISSKGTELFMTGEQNGAVTSERIGDLSFTYDVAQRQKDSTIYDTVNYRLRGLYNDTTKKSICIGGVNRA